MWQWFTTPQVYYATEMLVWNNTWFRASSMNLTLQILCEDIRFAWMVKEHRANIILYFVANMFWFRFNT